MGSYYAEAIKVFSRHKRTNKESDEIQRSVGAKSDGQSLKLLLRFEMDCVLMKENMSAVSNEIFRRF